MSIPHSRKSLHRLDHPLTEEVTKRHAPSVNKENPAAAAGNSNNNNNQQPIPKALLSGQYQEFQSLLTDAETMPAVLERSSVLLREASLTEEADLFRGRFKVDCAECIKNAYSMFREIYRSPRSGCLSTSIAEDVMSLLELQNDVLMEFVAEHEDQKDLLVADVYQSIFGNLTETQNNLLPLFLNSVEDCCAAANDFFRLSNKLEAFCDTLVTEYQAPYSVQECGLDLVAKLSQDAVYAAERVQVFFIRSINSTDLPQDFFSLAWEEDWTHNETMTDLLQRLDMLLPHLETWLENEVLFGKALHSSCKAIICFYIRCLVEKADGLSRKRGRGAKPFANPRRALLRMQDDIAMLRQFFADHAQDNETLGRILANEMRMLEVVVECLSAEDADSLEAVIVVLHKRTGADTLVTRYFVGDLLALVPLDEKNPGRVQGILEGIEADLEMVSSATQEHNRMLTASQKTDLAFLHIDEMLRAIYEEKFLQGTLPLCFCLLPKTAKAEGGQEAVGKRVRSLTRRMMELPARRQGEKRGKDTNSVV